MRIILLLLFFYIQTNANAGELISIPEYNFNDLVVKQTNETANSSKLNHTSYLVNEYINENYGNAFQMGCLVLNSTPDQSLKMDYEHGFVRLVTTFTGVNKVMSYTPIRELVNNPLRPAVFDGQYHVSH